MTVLPFSVSNTANFSRSATGHQFEEIYVKNVCCRIVAIRRKRHLVRRRRKNGEQVDGGVICQPPHIAAIGIDSDFLEDQAFSPDGKFIFFVSTFSGNADIYRLPFRPGRTSSMKEAENLTDHAS
jgi:hypothetical protein